MATRSAIIFLASCIFAFTSADSINQVEKLKTKITFVDNIETLLKENPEFDLIPLEKSVLEQKLRSVDIEYTLGRRESGDRLVAQGNNSYVYPNLQDTKLQFDYPLSGRDAYLTYVQIDVQQSSNEGRAFVIRGGIHQRFISVVVEAKRTYYFNYRAAFYGI